MKSNLSFLTYLVAFFATHTTCAPQRTFDDSFYVSSGQTCNVPGGIKGTYLTALGEIKSSCYGLAFDPSSFSYTSEHREMRCWFKKECSTKGVPGQCLNKECLSDSQQQNWSKDTTCPSSKLDVGCYAEPASNTGKSLDKQAFSTDSFVVAADSPSSYSTTPLPPPTSFQIVQLPPTEFDSSSSSSITTATTTTEAAAAAAAVNSPKEADYLVQNDLGETEYPYPLLNEKPQVELPSNAGNSAPPSFDAWAMPKFVG